MACHVIMGENDTPARGIMDQGQGPAWLSGSARFFSKFVLSVGIQLFGLKTTSHGKFDLKI